MPHAPANDHGPVRELLPDVFWLQGTVRMGPGVTINRTMVVLRHEGQLAVVNAIRPQDPVVLDALGTVRHVFRIGVHGMDDAWYRDHYDVTHWAPEGLCDTDRPLSPDTELPIPWASVFAFENTVDPEAILVLDRGDGFLAAGDALQHWPDTERCSFLAKGVTRLMGFQAHPVQIGPPWRRRMTPAGGSLEPDFRRLLTLPWDGLLGAHGQPMASGAKAAVTHTVAATYG